MDFFSSVSWHSHTRSSQRDDVLRCCLLVLYSSVTSAPQCISNGWCGRPHTLRAGTTEWPTVRPLIVSSTRLRRAWPRRSRSPAPSGQKPCRPGHVQRARGEVGSPGAGPPQSVPPRAHDCLRARSVRRCGGAGLGLAAGTSSGLPKYIYSLETILREALQQADGGVGSPGAGSLPSVPIFRRGRETALVRGARAQVANSASLYVARTTKRPCMRLGALRMITFP